MNIELTAAIIAAGAACAAAFLSAVSALSSAKQNSNAQREIAALNIYVAAKLNAFKDVELALEAWSKDYSLENYAAVHRAINVASFMVSESTVMAMKTVEDYISRYEATGMPPFPSLDVQKFHKARAAMIIAMRKDLQTVQLPEIKSATKQKD